MRHNRSSGKCWLTLPLRAPEVKEGGHAGRAGDSCPATERRNKLGIQTLGQPTLSRLPQPLTQPLLHRGRDTLQRRQAKSKPLRLDDVVVRCQFHHRVHVLCEKII